MWKLFALTILMLITLFGQSISDQAGKPKTTTDGGAAPAGSGGVFPHRATGLGAISSRQKATSENTAAVSAQRGYWERAFGPAYAANWAVVIVAIVASLVAWLTLVKIGDQKMLMERQTKIMEQQVVLAQAPFRQWLQLEDWDVREIFGEHLRLVVRVHLANATNYPVTLLSGEVVFDDSPYGTFTWNVGENRFIAPRKQLDIQTSYILSTEQMSEFMKGAITFRIKGNFLHKGALGDDVKTSQVFSGKLTCGLRRQTDFTPDLDMNPASAPPGIEL